jgi:TetR/AcrR family transcriptional repressor of nem operon
MSPREVCGMGRSAKIDEAQLLDSVTNLFWRDGCDATSIRDIETEVGIRAPSLYRRFESRDVLISRCIDRYVETVVAARIGRYLESEVEPIVGLRRFFLSVLKTPKGESAPRGCLLTTTSGQRAVSAVEVRESVARGLALIEDALTAQGVRAQLEGDIRPDLEPEDLGALLMASFQGFLVLSRAGTSGLSKKVESLFFSIRP